MLQTTSVVLMVRPAHFGFNPQTAEDNIYQHTEKFLERDKIKLLARQEFDHFVELLQSSGVDVLVVEDSIDPQKTDAVFPNNWFSTHDDGKLLLFPLCAPNRRTERRKDLIEILIKEGFRINEIIDLTFFEESHQFLEGTGSMVLDRVNKIAYACESNRTHSVPLEYFGRLMGYKIMKFNAFHQINGIKYPIYHTNVMMNIGKTIAVVCLDAITSSNQKMRLKQSLENSGKKIIPITLPQKMNFAGNMLEVESKGGDSHTIMSQTAYNSLKKGQRQTIEKYTTIVAPDIPTIEKLGGGSVRCMMAEIFLPRQILPPST